MLGFKQNFGNPEVNYLNTQYLLVSYKDSSIVPTSHFHLNYQPKMVFNFIKYFISLTPSILSVISYFLKKKYPIESNIQIVDINKNIVNKKKFCLGYGYDSIINEEKEYKEYKDNEDKEDNEDDKSNLENKFFKILNPITNSFTIFVK